jgi:hypothetical protein
MDHGWLSQDRRSASFCFWRFSNRESGASRQKSLDKFKTQVLDMTRTHWDQLPQLIHELTPYLSDGAATFASARPNVLTHLQTRIRRRLCWDPLATVAEQAQLLQ